MNPYEEYLGRVRARDILRSLKVKPTTTRILRGEVGGSFTTIKRRIDEGADLGLILTVRERKWPYRRRLFLSARGMRLVDWMNDFEGFE